MDVLTMIIIAAGLSMDSFAVSVVNGFCIRNFKPGRVMLIAFSSALFQTVMPVAGWFAGGAIATYIQSADHWVAFTLLLYLGVRMILSGGGNDNRSREINTAQILTQSFATSIDALAVGLSLAVLKVNILIPAVIIGVTTFLFSIAGIVTGRYSGKRFKRGSEMIGGVILILIGLKILVEHLSIHG